MLRYLLDYSYVFFYDHDHSIGTPIVIKSLPFQLAFHCILQAMNYTLQKKKAAKNINHANVNKDIRRHSHSQYHK
jgi:hypothetical protein